MTTRKAITLTEVLVVILILSVVTSIMLPTFTRAKDRAYTAVCASNMHQIYLAIHMYRADFDSSPPNSLVWPGLSTYYPQLLHCPKSAATDYGFDYSIVASLPPIKISGSERLAECMELRGGEFPVVRDYNHLQNGNLALPESFYYFVRENGAFDIVPSRLILSIRGPCDTEYVSPESNL